MSNEAERVGENTVVSDSRKEMRKSSIVVLVNCKLKEEALGVRKGRPKLTTTQTFERARQPVA